MKKPITSATIKPIAARTPETTTSAKPVDQVKVTKPLNTPGKLTTHLFDKENYKWMLAGLVVIAIGFILMAGGKSSNPNVFQDNDVYSFRRITIAPLLIIGGFIIQIVAIMRKSSARASHDV